MCLADARHSSLPPITLWFLLLFLGWCILPGPPTVVFVFVTRRVSFKTVIAGQFPHLNILGLVTRKSLAIRLPFARQMNISRTHSGAWRLTRAGGVSFVLHLAKYVLANMTTRHLFSLFFSRFCFRGRPTLVAMYHQKPSTGILNIWVGFNFFPSLAAAFLDQFLVQLQLCQPANKSHKLVQIEELNLVSPGRKEMN